MTVMKYIKHGEKLSEGICQILNKEDFKDVTFHCEGKSLTCHKVILATASAYFERMFKSELTESNVIEVRTMSYDHFSAVIKFIYTGELEFSPEDAQDLLHIADMMHLVGLKDVLSEYFFLHMDAENCLGFHSMSTLLSAEQLEKDSFKYIQNHFIDVSKCCEYLDLNLDRTVFYLGLPDLLCESEDVICEAGLRWVLHRPEERLEKLTDVLNVIRLENLTSDFILSSILEDQVLKKNQEAITQVSAVFKHILFGMPLPSTVKSLYPRTKTEECMGIALIWLGDDITNLQAGGDITNQQTRDDNNGADDNSVESAEVKEVYTNVGLFAFKENGNFCMQKVISKKTGELSLTADSRVSAIVIDNAIFIPFSVINPFERLSNKKHVFTNGVYRYDVKKNHLKSSIFPSSSGEHYMVVAGKNDHTYNGAILIALFVTKVYHSDVTPLKVEFSSVASYVYEKKIWVKPAFKLVKKKIPYTILDGHFTCFVHKDYLFVLGVSFKSSKFTHIVSFDLKSFSSHILPVELPLELYNATSVVCRETAIVSGSGKIFTVSLGELEKMANELEEVTTKMRTTSLSTVSDHQCLNNIIVESPLKGFTNSESNKFHLHVVGNQLIAFGGSDEKFKACDIMAVDIDRVERSGDSVDWVKVGEIPSEVSNVQLSATVKFTGADFKEC